MSCDVRCSREGRSLLASGVGEPGRLWPEAAAGGCCALVRGSFGVPLAGWCPMREMGFMRSLLFQSLSGRWEEIDSRLSTVPGGSRRQGLRL